MINLYILRHGKAVKPKEGLKDFDRKLNKKGTAQINQVGYMLKQSEVNFDRIIASGAQRTEETAQIINFYTGSPKILFDDNLYLTDKGSLLQKIQQEGTGKNVLLVGHNFGLSEYLNSLAGTQLTLSTGMLVQIKFNFTDWKMVDVATGDIDQIIDPQVHSF